MRTIKLLGLLLMLLPISIFAQSTVSGTVVNDNGMPIPGVNILVKNTTKGTTTDFDGNYSIDLEKGETLSFSYIGYRTQDIVFNGNNTRINVSMVEDAEALKEVVVVGYGDQTVKSISGSVASVTEKDFNKGNIVTSESLIQGRVPGLSITKGGGPGSGSEITIRGGSSFNASNAPLIVLDGLPLNNETAAGTRSILSSINPNDIESFSVLKDASASAIYGIRAAGGVIIINTKKGRGELNVTLDVQRNVTKIDNSIDVLNASQFRTLVSDNFPDRLDELGEANTNWQDEIYRDAVSSDINLSARGALFGEIPTRLSLNRSDQQGLRRTSKFDRTTASLSINPRLFDDHLKVGLNANYSNVDNRFAAGVEGSAIAFDPTQPVRDPGSPYGGFFEFRDNDGSASSNVPRNPVAELLQTRNVSNADRFFGNLNLDYKFHFLPALSLVTNLGIDRTESGGAFSRPRTSALGVNAEQGEFIGNLSRYSQKRTNTSADAYFIFDDNYGDFGVKLTAGYSYQKFESESFTTGEILDPNAQGPRTTVADDVVFIGYFGRANLSFKEKYFINGSIRRDGVSKFNPEDRIEYFPSVSGAWQISEEDFLKDSQVISNLKVRAGWGQLGQQDISSTTDYLSRYQRGLSNQQYRFGPNAIVPLQPLYTNPNISWEILTEINLGLDFAFFDDRISGSVDVFERTADDLLSFVPVPDGANFSNQGFQNIGEFVSKGVEINLDYNVIRQDDLNWDVNYNFTAFDREITRLAFGQDIFVGGISGGTGNTIQVQREGEWPNSFFTYAQLYDQSGQPIEGAYADINGDGTIDDRDRYVSGNGQADMLMGFQSNLTYKNFDFNFNLRASIGGEIYNNVNSSRAQLGNLDLAAPNNLPVQVLETGFARTPDVILSDFYLEDASFLRMDNITLGYTLENFNKDSTSLRFWMGLQNAFIITDYSGIDPELGSGGIDNTIYPRGRTYLLGVNYNF
ncbi:SusC/RagA family TonB-linked outer membrane protein [Psychroflexus sediminis]|uniref:Iron complex outermembrane recepter protein n=1 Tax=Psychroflexus sediminis TaxID=470826 RepID=A0A1G7WPA5_9FLAO|nr:SusC/RagA family TonB-linked outer membrane protein [Psychroflexus sediminis]SDG73724.1 iron complex outermembrane recepter protein [Psychroflexus sediminis]